MSLDRPYVLIVEDDADAQQVARHILEYIDVAVECANDAEIGEFLLFSKPDYCRLVIIDLALPGKDGWQLLSDIQTNDATSHLKCVAMTAFHRPSLREQALQAGFVDYFPKPISPTGFAEAIEHILRE